MCVRSAHPTDVIPVAFGAYKLPSGREESVFILLNREGSAYAFYRGTSHPSESAAGTMSSWLML
jgi:hypothetical protein